MFIRGNKNLKRNGCCIFCDNMTSFLILFPVFMPVCKFVILLAFRFLLLFLYNVHVHVKWFATG